MSTQAQADIALGSIVAAPGTRATGFVPVDVGEGRTVELPIVIVNGAMPGPRVAVTAGIHGAEYVSIALPPPEIASTSAVFSIVFNSILSGKELSCTYRVPGSETQRTIEPHHLHKQSGIWYEWH